jgi:hypothetical protein
VPVEPPTISADALAQHGALGNPILSQALAAHQTDLNLGLIKPAAMLGRVMGRETPPDRAVKLVDGLAGESPASANFPVGTVVIFGDGAGDQTVGSPEVNVLDGWIEIRSAPTRRANKAAGRSASEP